MMCVCVCSRVVAWMVVVALVSCGDFVCLSRALLVYEGELYLTERNLRQSEFQQLFRRVIYLINSISTDHTISAACNYISEGLTKIKHTFVITLLTEDQAIQRIFHQIALRIKLENNQKYTQNMLKCLVKLIIHLANEEKETDPFQLSFSEVTLQIAQWIENVILTEPPHYCHYPDLYRLMDVLASVSDFNFSKVLHPLFASYEVKVPYTVSTSILSKILPRNNNPIELQRAGVFPFILKAVSENHPTVNSILINLLVNFLHENRLNLKVSHVLCTNLLSKHEYILWLKAILFENSDDSYFWRMKLIQNTFRHVINAGGRRLLVETYVKRYKVVDQMVLAGLALKREEGVVEVVHVGCEIVCEMVEFEGSVDFLGRLMGHCDVGSLVSMGLKMPPLYSLRPTRSALKLVETICKKILKKHHTQQPTSNHNNNNNIMHYNNACNNDISMIMHYNNACNNDISTIMHYNYACNNDISTIMQNNNACVKNDNSNNNDNNNNNRDSRIGTVGACDEYVMGLPGGYLTDLGTWSVPETVSSLEVSSVESNLLLGDSSSLSTAEALLEIYFAVLTDEEGSSFLSSSSGAAATLDDSDSNSLVSVRSSGDDFSGIGFGAGCVILPVLRALLADLSGSWLLKLEEVVGLASEARKCALLLGQVICKLEEIHKYI